MSDHREGKVLEGWDHDLPPPIIGDAESRGAGMECLGPSYQKLWANQNPP